MEKDLHFLDDLFPFTRNDEEMIGMRNEGLEDQEEFWNEVMNQDTSLIDSIIADIENVKSQDKNNTSLMDDIESIKDLIDIYPENNVEASKGIASELIGSDLDDGILSDDSGLDYCHLVSPLSVSNSESDHTSDHFVATDKAKVQHSFSLSNLPGSSFVPRFINTVFKKNGNTIILPVVTLKSSQSKPVTIKVAKKRKVSDSSDSSSKTNTSTETSYIKTSLKSKYPALILTEEERRVCERDKIKLPTHYPLTRDEEKNLKKIRRKIRNKVSAQDSRKRKREYMTDMEKRVEDSSKETEALKQKLLDLETQNKTLAGQLRRLQQYIVNNGLKQNQPSTAMLVLLLSTALFLMTGQVEQHDGNKPVSQEVDIFHSLKMPPLPGQSRSLLQIKEDYDESNEANPTAPMSVKTTGKIEPLLSSTSILIKHQERKPQLIDHDYSSLGKKFAPDYMTSKRAKRSYIVEDEPPRGYGFADTKNETMYPMKEKGDVEADGLYFMKGNELTLPESDEDFLLEGGHQFQKLSVDVAASDGIRTVVLHVPTDIM